MARLCMVIGTRPQLVKAAVLLPELPGTVLVDTGQHWDDGLAGLLFAELGLPQPEYSLGVASSDVGAMVAGLEPILRAERPEAVVVIGDTNSTLAATLAAQAHRIPVVHVEAGVRSFDRTMPEERNRAAVDHIATWCLAPTEDAVVNLAEEGITRGVVLVGDLMADAVVRYLDRAFVPMGLVSGGYVFATIHRAANREFAAMSAWLGILEAVPYPVMLALHPGTRDALRRAGTIVLPRNVTDIGPVGYRASLALQYHASAVVTDSGGVERESAWLGTPVVVLREASEWPEFARAGRTHHVGLDGTMAARALVSARRSPEAIPTGAARRIASVLASLSAAVAA